MGPPGPFGQCEIELEIPALRRNLGSRRQTERQLMSIKPADVKQAILAGDDFGHEMRVGHIFAKLTVTARGQFTNPAIFEILGHGGTYVDSVMGKPRQFDYRYRISRFDQTPLNVHYVLLAVECKNLYKESPLVVCGRARALDEAYHVRIETENDEPAGAFWCKMRKVSGTQACYQENTFVGKSVLRLNEAKVDGKWQWKAATDPDIYDKWSQALASSVELAEAAATYAEKDAARRFSSVVLPVVVLPEDSLWTISYDAEGLIREDPRMADECELFVERKLNVRGNQFVLTHIHFVSLRGFSKLLSRFAQDDTIWERFFVAPGAEI
jgi:hypothetical protein